MTLGDRWRETGARPPGFDYLRIILSVSIILFHTASVSHGLQAERWFWLGPLRPLVYALVPAFFALSGFLVAASLCRHDLPSFFTLRFIRIFPALVVELTISALIVGAIFTTLPLSDYFSSKAFFAYFGNLVGRMRYGLPGVFDDLPLPGLVNVQIWTIPYELECYLLLGCLAMVGLTRRPTWFLAFAVCATVGWTIVEWLGSHQHRFDAASNRMIVFCFMFGVALFLLQEQIPHSSFVFMASIVSFSLMIYHEPLINAAALPAAYATVFLGLGRVRRSVITRGADHSYGLYLYGFPIQQAVCAALPDLREWYWNALIALPIIWLCAFASWHLVEAPLLRRRQQFLSAVGALRQRLRQ